jgi:hypothetical protein
MRAPDHCGRESRLVLAGEIRDYGRTFHRGDLVVARSGRACTPEAAGREPCVCLVVQPADSSPAALRHT